MKGVDDYENDKKVQYGRHKSHCQIARWGVQKEIGPTVQGTCTSCTSRDRQHAFKSTFRRQMRLWRHRRCTSSRTVYCLPTPESSQRDRLDSGRNRSAPRLLLSDRWYRGVLCRSTESMFWKKLNTCLVKDRKPTAYLRF